MDDFERKPSKRWIVRKLDMVRVPRDWTPPNDPERVHWQEVVPVSPATPAGAVSAERTEKLRVMCIERGNEIKRLEAVTEAQSRAIEALRQRNIALRDQLRGAVSAERDLVERAVYPISAALSCAAHPWHDSDDARRWLMQAAALQQHRGAVSDE